MKKYEILDSKKFRKLNDKHKNEIVLSTLAAFTFLETSIATLAGGIYSFSTSQPVAGAILLGSSILTAGASAFCSQYSDYVNSENITMVQKQMSNLNERYLDEKYKAIIRR